MKIDPKYLPSRKFVIVLSSIIAVALIVLAFSFRRSGSYEATNDNSLTVAASSSFEAFKQVDSDHDGLPDWQEALYGTDPKNPDTDGDGTPDGEEIKEGRDPLKANTAPKGQEPNDKISAEQIAQDQKTLQEYNSLSLTDKYARDLFSQYIATKQVGSTLSQTDQEVLALSALPDIQVKTYTINDIKTYSATNTQAEARKYVNDVAYIVYQTAAIKEKYKIKDESIVLDEIMASSDSSSIKDLGPVLNLLVAELRAFLALPMDGDFASIHLNLINTLGNKIAGLYGMEKLYSDPLQTMILLKNYQDGDDGMYTAVSSIIDLANSQRITFSTNEYGYYFVNMIKLQ
jgi:hypothetical protein